MTIIHQDKVLNSPKLNASVLLAENEREVAELARVAAENQRIIAESTRKSAYQYAVEGGYTGTEAEFTAKMAEEVLPVTNIDAATSGQILSSNGDGTSTFTTPNSDLIHVLDSAGNFVGENVEDVLAEVLDKYHRGINEYSTVPVFTDGLLTQVEELNGATVIKRTSITYNTDGTVNIITEIFPNNTVTSTLHYTNGELTSITKQVIAGGL